MSEIDMSRYVLGIDPGLVGAWAVLDERGELVEVGDMPVSAGEVDVIALDLTLAKFVRVYGGQGIKRAALEWPKVMPGNGAKSGYSMGLSLGRIETVLLLAGVGVQRVAPSAWKRAMGLSKDKGASRLMAKQAWPTFADQFARVRDDGRAEAALLAKWYETKVVKP